MSELLNCPFCGKKAKIKETYWPNGKGLRWRRVFCANCKINSVSRVDIEDLKKHWNTRPAERMDLDMGELDKIFNRWQLHEHFEQTTKSGIPDWNYKGMKDDIISTFAYQNIKWPAKRKETEPYNQYANIQWNKAIEACIKAYNEAKDRK